MIKILPILFLSLFSNLIFAQDCPSNINILPMYGKVQKCKEQIESDNKFIEEMDILFENRTLSAKDRINSAWSYFNNKDYSTAIKRFNQAWLLKKDMYEIYWGYANISALNDNLSEALDFFKIASEYNPENANYYYSYALANSQFYIKNKNKLYLHNAIQNLDKAIKIDNKNTHVYDLMASIYKELKDYDKMNFYLEKVKNSK